MTGGKTQEVGKQTAEHLSWKALSDRTSYVLSIFFRLIDMPWHVTLIKQFVFGLNFCLVIIAFSTLAERGLWEQINSVLREQIRIETGIFSQLLPQL